MNSLQIILITCLAFFKKVDHKGPQIAIYNCMFWGAMSGLVMGDIKTGLMIGGMFQLMSLGVTSIGGSSVPDYQIGAIISTSIAISTGKGIEAGIAIGLPVAMACIQLDVLQNLIDGYLVRKAEAYCNKGDFKKMSAMIWLCIPVTGLSTAVPAFFAAAFGPSVVEAFMSLLPEWFLPGLSIAGKILPVCGISALLLYMPAKQHFEYILFGFILSAYLNIPLLGIVLAGVGFAHMSYKKNVGREVTGSEGRVVLKQEDTSEKSDLKRTELEALDLKKAASKKMLSAQKLTKKDLRKTGRRWNWSLESFNYENQMAGGVVYALAPALRKIYAKDEEYQESLNQHFRFFNTTPYLGNLILGLVLSMEEHYGIKSSHSVQSMKVGLMGAITGFGDSIFYVLLPTIFGSIGGYMAVEGNPVGMIIWLGYGLLFFFWRPCLVEFAYEGGKKLMDALEEQLHIFTEAASVLGLTVAGAMIPTVITIKTPLTFVSGEVTKELQAVLDGILPSILPVILTGIVWILLKKKVKLVWIILLIIIASCFCAAFGILV